MNREQRTQTHSATLNIEHLYPSLYRTFAKHIFKTIYKRKTVCQKANGNVVCEMCCDDSMQSESNKSISTPRHRLSPVGERGIGILKIELMCKWEKISGTSFTIKRTDEKKKPNPNWLTQMRKFCQNVILAAETFDYFLAWKSNGNFNVDNPMETSSFRCFGFFFASFSLLNSQNEDMVTPFADFPFISALQLLFVNRQSQIWTNLNFSLHSMTFKGHFTDSHGKIHPILLYSFFLLNLICVCNLLPQKEVITIFTSLWIYNKTLCAWFQSSSSFQSIPSALRMKQI